VVVATLLAVVLVAACASDDDGEDAEVGGVVRERAEEAEDAPTAEDEAAESDEPEEVEVTDADDGDDADEAPSNDTSTATGGQPAPSGPSPVSLEAGLGLRGDSIGFGPEGTEILASGPLESPPAVGARSDAVRPGEADEVQCRSSLQAPQDRGLTAVGDLEISLLIERHDGTSRRVPLLIMELDVELAAGARHELPTTRSRAFDRDVVASLSCEADCRPA
jgi:hypothetical protein